LVSCAIYTRKSTEDGLEQEYNSLDAQFDACMAYASSQRHEGWMVVKDRYDDGGFSGGTLERPGLKWLLADIEAGKVDIILLYKIDRLTRSLSDFAKIVDILDRKGASFVSITQSFNTTTSMGRLTLNMLLSFAQFEREVTGERIRDKIAASKRKGIWMGGPVPLGYDVIERKLAVNEPEAELVRHIMQRYLALRSVRDLVTELADEGHRTKIQFRTSTANRGGCTFQRGTLYHLLANKIYRGKIVHKGEVFDGEHHAIVPEDLWNDVQLMLAARSQGGNSRASPSRISLLTGLLYDGEGRAMVPTHTQKGNRRFRYYATRPDLVDQSTAWRAKAQDLESIVISQLIATLRRPAEIECLLTPSTYNAEQAQDLFSVAYRLAEQLQTCPSVKKQQMLAMCLLRVELHHTKVEIELNNEGLLKALDNKDNFSVSSANLFIQCPAMKVRRGQELRLVIPPSHSNDLPAPRDDKLIALVTESRATLELILKNPNKSLPALASEHRRCRIRMAKLAKLACLAPDILNIILNGKQPVNLTPRRLLNAGLPLGWDEQKRVLGFA